MGKVHYRTVCANGAGARLNKLLGISCGLLFLMFAWPLAAQADSRAQAKRMHDRLTGIPPSAVVLASMAAQIEGGNPQAAALIAMDNPSFYNVTLKNLITPWTNRDRTPFAPLNDYTATVIGMVRDDIGFDQLLSANLVYHANGIQVSGNTVPPYSGSSNAHYEWLEDRGVNLQAALVAATQSEMTGIDAAATAGVMTTRAAADAFFVAGTNRAMFRFTMLNHYCMDLEQIKDATRSPDRIRQDVSRSPGGDSRLFNNNCVSCHSGMDPMAQAFAYYNFNELSGNMEYTPGNVQPKYHINSETFSPGFITPDDRWDNYWRAGPNQILGWSNASPGSGNGAKSLGQELAGSRAFASCQVKKAFRVTCLRDPLDFSDRQAITQITDQFISDGYQMKPVFAETAAYCRGD